MTDLDRQTQEQAAREALDAQVLRGLTASVDDHEIVWGTIEDIDAAAWDDLQRALLERDQTGSIQRPTRPSPS